MERLIKAYFNSLAGLRQAFATETAIRQEVIVLILAMPAAFLIAENPWTRLALIGVVVMVLVVEILNTAVEKLCDHVRPEIHADIKYVKDLGSAAVLATSLIAGCAWLIALWQRLS